MAAASFFIPLGARAETRNQKLEMERARRREERFIAQRTRDGAAVLTSAGRPVHPAKTCGMEKSAQERNGKNKSACSVRNDGCGWRAGLTAWLKPCLPRFVALRHGRSCALTRCHYDA